MGSALEHSSLRKLQFLPSTVIGNNKNWKGIYLHYKVVFSFFLKI